MIVIITVIVEIREILSGGSYSGESEIFSLLLKRSSVSLRFAEQATMPFVKFKIRWKNVFNSFDENLLVFSFQTYCFIK